MLNTRAVAETEEHFQIALEKVVNRMFFRGPIKIIHFYICLFLFVYSS